jgi:primosomal replication protein N''
MPNIRHEKAINRLSVLLEHLSVQAKKTDDLNSKQKSHRLIENNNLFSEHLFTTQSDKIFLYAEEIKARLNEFSRLHTVSGDNTNKAEFAKSSLLLIEQQIAALMNAMRANETMHQAAQASFNAKKNIRIKSAQATQLKHTDKYNKVTKSVLLSSHQLYKQLSEHHEFERRLKNMITERDQQRNLAKTANIDKLSQEVLALHQRLGRCRKAISSIEKNIEQVEKGKLRK